MGLHLEQLREAIDSIRRRRVWCSSEGKCKHCSEEWAILMKALLVALEVGAEGSETDEAGIYYGEFTHLVEKEMAKDYA